MVDVSGVGPGLPSQSRDYKPADITDDFAKKFINTKSKDQVVILDNLSKSARDALLDKLAESYLPATQGGRDNILKKLAPETKAVLADHLEGMALKMGSDLRFSYGSAAIQVTYALTFDYCNFSMSQRAALLKKLPDQVRRLVDYYLVHLAWDGQKATMSDPFYTPLYRKAADAIKAELSSQRGRHPGETEFVIKFIPIGGTRAQTMVVC